MSPFLKLSDVVNQLDLRWNEKLSAQKTGASTTPATYKPDTHIRPAPDKFVALLICCHST
jgi:hypothetical protein